jgi:hypothetical protein
MDDEAPISLQNIPPGSQVLIFTATAEAEVIKAADIQARENKE